jgi:hypothetical protein
MGDDALAAGFINGQKTAIDLNCTANDIDIAEAVVDSFSTDGVTWQLLAPGDTISCLPNSNVLVSTSANLENNATSRYDIGVWIADSTNLAVPTTGGGKTILTTALTGRCTHYNLTRDSAGVANLDGGDACGDMSSGGLTALHLDILTVKCQPTSATNAIVGVGACIGWQNSVGGADRVCPDTGSATTFRRKTTPETSSKCNCNPMLLPMKVKSVLRVDKVTVPAADPASFTFTPTGYNGGNTFNLTDASTPFSSGPIDPGTYSVAETTIPAGWDLTARACFFTDSTNVSFPFSNVGTNGVSVTLPLTGVDITCAFTNTKRPQLTLKKIIVNDNGGTKTVDDFSIVTSAGTPSWTCNTVTNTTTCTSQAFTVSAGSSTFSESDVTGYAEGTWSCSPVAATGTAFGAGSVSLTAGQSTTCEITNDDSPAQLTLKKIIVNDNGGTKTVDDFSIITSAGTPTWTCVPNGTTTTCTSQTFAVSAGSSTFSESDVTGYTEGTWSCSPVAATGTAFGGGSVTLANGQSTTCQITNNDDAAHLTLKKIIVSDNGGTKTVDDFSIVTSAGTPTWTCVPNGTTTTCTSQNFSEDAGSSTFSESDVTGYTEGTWSCSPVSATGTAFGGGSVTLANGQSTTCEITNNDDAAHLTLKKIISNDNGGSATVGAFGIATSAGSPSFSCNTVGSTTTCTSQNFAVSAGTSTFSEQNVANYTEGTWSCSPVAATQGKTAFNDGAVSLANGQSTTCEITNNDDVVGRSAIAPTATTCEAFATNNFSTLATLLASVKTGKINTVSPGVFFYYAQVEVPAGGGTVSLTQTVIPGSMTLPLYQVQQGQAYLYTFSNGTCTRVATFTLNTAQTAGSVSVPGGSYILGVKYTPEAAKGVSTIPSDPAPNLLLSTHQYSVTGGLSASVDTRVKP